MMKRIAWIVLSLGLLASSPALAVCPATLQLKDNAGATPTAKYTDDGAGNCMANVAVIDGGDVTQGAKADAAYAGSGSSSVVALLKGIYNRIVDLITAASSPLASQGTSIGVGGVGVIGSAASGGNQLAVNANGQASATLSPTPSLANGNGTVTVPSSEATSAISHASTTALGTSLLAKAGAGNLHAYNCTAITGGAAGFCIAYNAASVPGTGPLTGASVLDFCYYDTSARGCSLGRYPYGAQYGTGIVILVTSAATPYTYTTGVNTAAIEADFK